ncbi:MAG: hypothetical protein RIQ67_1708 [Pseudomonadota bacterium]
MVDSSFDPSGVAKAFIYRLKTIAYEVRKSTITLQAERPKASR